MTLGQPFVAKHREELLSAATGDILEIGFGSGLNLPHYADHVRAIIAEQPFENVDAKEFYLEQTPRSHGYIYQGMARK